MGPVQRRSFLKRSLIFGAAAVGGGAYLGLQSNRELPRPTRQLHVLDPVSFGVLVRFAERILPLEPADPRWVAHEVDGALRYASPEAQADLRLVLGVLENSLSGVFTRFNATLFSELDADARDIAISRWGDSPVAMLRGATNSLRKLCLGAFYAPLGHAKAIGYLGPPFDKPRPKPIEARQPLSAPYRRGQYLPAPNSEATEGTTSSTTSEGGTP